MSIDVATIELNYTKIGIILLAIYNHFDAEKSPLTEIIRR